MSISKEYILKGRQMGRLSLFDKNFKEFVIPKMKEGETIGIPVDGGVAIFEFKGISKPKTKNKYNSMELL